MNQVRLRTVRNMETGKELTISSSKAKELIREGWIEVRAEPGQQKAAAPAAAQKRKGFWGWLFG
jgi:endonuclease YncB( thermonuclease family)